MHAIQQLPENYKIIREIDLQKDKKTALKVNGLALALTVITRALGFAIHPLNIDIESDGDLKLFIIKCVILCVGYIVYIILHEFTHGMAMKHFGGKEVRYGFTGLYAFAGSLQDYFDRYSYLRIALAPVVIWGIIFLILNILIPSWFWVIYFWQIGNISGAAGDIYVAILTSRMPESLRVKDTGVSMTMYLPE